jgi:heme exporter protein A
MNEHTLQLIARDLACRRGGREIFAGVDFAVQGGEMLILRGPNGVGKTTLLRTLAGHIPLARGALELKGAGDNEPIAQACHYVAHQNANKPALTVRENLHFWSSFFGGAPEKVGEALKALHLNALAHLPAGVLSAGQKRRLALARLVLAHRPIWLLDEPTVGLDVDSQAALRALMAEHLASGGMIIASTHIDLGMDNTRTLVFKRGASGAPASAEVQDMAEAAS